MHFYALIFFKIQKFIFFFIKLAALFRKKNSFSSEKKKPFVLEKKSLYFGRKFSRIQIKFHFFELQSYEIANIASLSRLLPKSPILEPRNRGFSPIGDLSPSPNSYRQPYVQNRGFGDLSPEMATLPAEQRANDTATGWS